MMNPLLLTTATAVLLLTACGQATGQAPEHVTGHASGQVTQHIIGQDLSQSSAATVNKSGIDWSALESYEHALSNQALNITRPGTHILSGKSSASVTVNSDDDVRLILNGVGINSATSAAIHIANADNTVIELAAGSENYLEDAPTRKDKGINGVIYSSDDLIFQGAGKLTVTSNFQDGIVSKDDLNFFSGNYIISSVDDGIRGKDSLVIEGGTFSIIAKGDGIKSSNDDSKKGNIHIKGGSIIIDSDDDGLAAVNNIVIDGGHINVLKSIEGMEASTITINDGDIRVIARDDGINAVNDNGLSNMSIIVNGGNINVTVGSGDTDAFDSNGTILIAGGHINVTAPTSAFDSNKGSVMTGGSLIVNGEPMSELPPQQRGGRRGGGGGMRGQ